MRKKYEPFMGCHFRNSLCKGEIVDRSNTGRRYCEFHTDIFDAVELVLYEKKQEKK